MFGRVRQVGIVDGLANIRLSKMTYTDVQLDDNSRQYAWERGQIDYSGIDSFDNIRRQVGQSSSHGSFLSSSCSPRVYSTTLIQL